MYILDKDISLRGDLFPTWLEVFWVPVGSPRLSGAVFSDLENAAFPHWEFLPIFILLGLKQNSPIVSSYFLEMKNPILRPAHLPSIVMPLHVSPGKDAAQGPLRVIALPQEAGWGQEGNLGLGDLPSPHGTYSHPALGPEVPSLQEDQSSLHISRLHSPARFKPHSLLHLPSAHHPLKGEKGGKKLPIL